MKIMIIDKDEAHTNRLHSRLDSMGYDALIVSQRDEAAQILSKNSYDVVFFDPAPLANPKQAVSTLKNASPTSLYFSIMGAPDSYEDTFMESGANLFLSKPVNGETLEAAILHATNLNRLRKQLSDVSTDFPSGGGILAKSAYNELFVSSIDRAERRGEKTFSLFVALSNYKKIVSEVSDYKAKEVSAHLGSHLANMRRQSDILAQTDDAEYAILFFGVEDSSEPKEATARFVSQFTGSHKPFDSFGVDVEMSFELIELPTGVCRIQEVIDFKK